MKTRTFLQDVMQLGITCFGYIKYEDLLENHIFKNKGRGQPSRELEQDNAGRIEGEQVLVHDNIPEAMYYKRMSWEIER